MQKLCVEIMSTKVTWDQARQITSRRKFRGRDEFSPGKHPLVVMLHDKCGQSFNKATAPSLP